MIERLGSRRAEGAPRAIGDFVLFVRDWLARVKQRSEFADGQLAKTFERRTSRVRIDADQAYGLGRWKVIVNPGEKLNEVELIEQIVLVPEHELTIRVVFSDHAPPIFESCDGLAE